MVTEWDALGCLLCRNQDQTTEDTECPICDPVHRSPERAKKPPKKIPEEQVKKEEQPAKVPEIPLEIPLVKNDEKLFTKLEIKRQSRLWPVGQINQLLISQPYKIEQRV